MINVQCYCQLSSIEAHIASLYSKKDTVWLGLVAFFTNVHIIYLYPQHLTVEKIWIYLQEFS